MPITRSAKKARRQSESKAVHNLRRKSGVSKAVKSLKKLVALGDRKEAEKAIAQVQQALDKAVKGNTLHKNTAARKKSRLAKLIKKL